MGTAIDGLISGLNTSNIIEQLMAIERRPIRLFQSQISETKAVQGVYDGLLSKLLSLKADAETLAAPSLFNTKTISSSNESVLTATATGTAPTGSFTFTVGQLATAEQAISRGFADKDTTTMTAGTLTIKHGFGTLDPKTRLSDLNGGDGVDRGEIKITDRSGASSVINLTTAVDVEDVIEAINADTTIDVTAAISGDGIVLTNNATATENFKVENVGSHTTATDLGLDKNVASDTITGDDVVNLATTTRLDALNDGLGVRTASGTDFRINVDGAGDTNIDISTAKTIQDVIDAIEAALPSLDVTIVNGSNALRITDTDGDGGSIAVTDVSGAAADLGILKSPAGDTLTGDAVLAGMNTVLLKNLDGGNGVTTAGGDDFTVTLSDGSSFNVDISSDVTVQDAIDSIATAAAAVDSGFIVRVSDSGDGIFMKDSKGGTGNISVTDISGAAADLGIAKTGSGSKLTGDDVDRQYLKEPVKLSKLNNGRGVFAGSIKITDRSGKVFTVDLSQETTIGDVIEDINGAASSASSDLTASINATGDGILLTSPTGGGSITVAEVSGGTTARDLNLLGTTTASTLDGSFQHDITVAATDTLKDVQDKINNLDKDFVSTILNDGSGTVPYRLSVLSERTGLAGTLVLNAGSTGLDFTRAVEAQDAAVVLGGTSGGTALLATDSDNVFEGLIEGVTINLHSASTTPVTLTLTVDEEHIADQVNDLVVNFNSIVDVIRAETDFDPETLKGGVLLGESTARLVESDLYRNLLKRVPGLPSSLNGLANVGVSIDTEGKAVFDREKFLDKLRSDFDGVKKLFVNGANIQDGTDLDELRNGQGVRIVDGLADFQITQRDGTAFNVDLTGAKTILAVITAINNATGNTGVTASIAGNGSGLKLVDTSSGSGDLKLKALHGSEAARDLGILKTAPTASGSSSTTLNGSTLNLNGFANLFVQRLDVLTRSSTGILPRTNEHLGEEIASYEDQIASLEERLAAKEKRLTDQFVRLERALSEMQNLSNFMSQQLLSLVGGGGKKG